MFSWVINVIQICPEIDFRKKMILEVYQLPSEQMVCVILKFQYFYHSISKLLN